MYSKSLPRAKPWPWVLPVQALVDPTHFSTTSYVQKISLGLSRTARKKPCKIFVEKAYVYIHLLRLLGAEYLFALPTSHLPVANAFILWRVRVQISYVKAQGSTEKLNKPPPILFKSSMKDKTEKVLNWEKQTVI